MFMPILPRPTIPNCIVCLLGCVRCGPVAVSAMSQLSTSDADFGEWEMSARVSCCYECRSARD